MFIVVSTPIFTHLVLRPLESSAYLLSQKNHPTHHSKAIVTLGGGALNHGIWSQPSLAPDAMLRIQKSLALHQSSPDKTLFIFSGGGSILGTDLVEGDATKTHLNRLNYKNFIIEKKSKTTFENALYTKRLLVDQKLWHHGFPITLVTSALHLVRSTQVFEAQGFQVYSLPSHYKTSSQILWLEPSSYMPNARSLALLSEAWHEYIGLFVYWIKGHFDPQITTQL
ncbi:MAG: YdcF family protein [Oligoflexales bacterium]